MPAEQAAAFLRRTHVALTAFTGCPGYLRGRVGRAADDPTAWVLTTEWEGVGAYRRSLSNYAVKVEAAPLLSIGRDEPSAFELLASLDGAGKLASAPSRRSPDAASRPAR